jgi:hypothetical protein
MNIVEIRVRRGREAERFNTALYRFLEIKLSSARELDGHASITSEPAGPWERKTVTLWSDDVAEEFAAFWRGF